MSLKIYLKILMIFIALTVFDPAFAQDKRGYKTVNFINNLPSSDLKMKVYRVDQSKIIEKGAVYRQSLDENTPPWISNLVGNKIKLKPEATSYAFAYVIENHSELPQYFFSNGHQVLPNEQSLGISVMCMCSNKIRNLKPKERMIFIGSINYIEPFLAHSKIDLVTKVIPVDIAYIKTNKLEEFIRD